MENRVGLILGVLGIGFVLHDKWAICRGFSTFVERGFWFARKVPGRGLTQIDTDSGKGWELSIIIQVPISLIYIISHVMLGVKLTLTTDFVDFRGFFGHRGARRAEGIVGHGFRGFCGFFGRREARGKSKGKRENGFATEGHRGRRGRGGG